MSKSIGQRIKELREQRNLTQEELGKLLGCAQTTVGNWENQSHRSPGRRVLTKLAQIFNVTVDYLVGIEKYERTIPCYDKAISKGFPWPAIDKFYPLNVASDEYEPGCFALRIQDNDLEPFVLRNDYGIFKKTAPENGDIIVIRFPEDDNRAMIRRLIIEQDMMALVSPNPRAKELGILLHILKQENDIIISASKGKGVIEGVFVGTKRPWKKIS